VNGIQVEILGFVEQKTALGFRNGSKGTQRWGKFATVNPFAIATQLKQSFLIPKFTATHSTMKLLRCPEFLSLSYWPYHTGAPKGEKIHPNAGVR
jgi:hypothetical protein